MSTILFECDVTEFDVIPNINNNENAFAINEKCVVINLIHKCGDIIIQTEIERKDAIQLAKLILFRYE